MLPPRATALRIVIKPLYRYGSSDELQDSRKEEREKLRSRVAPAQFALSFPVCGSGS